MSTCLDDVTSSTSHNMMGSTDHSNEQHQNNMMGMFNMLGQMVAPMTSDPNMMMMGAMNFPDVSI